MIRTLDYIKQLYNKLGKICGKILLPSKIKRYNDEINAPSATWELSPYEMGNYLIYKNRAKGYINRLKRDFWMHIKPKIDIIGTMGIEYLPFAKSKLRLLKKFMADLGIDYNNKRYKIKDTDIFVQSAMGYDLIRIRKEEQYYFYIFFVEMGESIGVIKITIDIKKGKYKASKTKIDLSDFIKVINGASTLLTVQSHPKLKEHKVGLPPPTGEGIYGWFTNYYIPDIENYGFWKFFQIAGYSVLLQVGFPNVYRPIKEGTAIADDFGTIISGEYIFEETDKPVIWASIIPKIVYDENTMYPISLGRKPIYFQDEKRNILNKIDITSITYLPKYDTFGLSYYVNNFKTKQSFSLSLPYGSNKLTYNTYLTEMKRTFNFNSRDWYTEMTVEEKLNMISNSSTAEGEPNIPTVLATLNDRVIYTIRDWTFEQTMEKPKNIKTGSIIGSGIQPYRYTAPWWIPECSYLSGNYEERLLVEDITQYCIITVVNEQSQTYSLHFGNILASTFNYKLIYEDDVIYMYGYTDHVMGDETDILGHITDACPYGGRFLNGSSTWEEITTPILYDNLKRISRETGEIFLSVMDYDSLPNEDTFISMITYNKYNNIMDETLEKEAPLVPHVGVIPSYVVPPIEYRSISRKNDYETATCYKLIYAIKGNLYTIDFPYKTIYSYGNYWIKGMDKSTSYSETKGERITGVSFHISNNQMVYTYIIENATPSQIPTFDRKRIIGIINLNGKMFPVGYNQEFEINDNNWNDFFEERKWTPTGTLKFLSNFAWKSISAIGVHAGK